MYGASEECNAGFAEKFVIDFYICNENSQFSISYPYYLPFVCVHAHASVYVSGLL